jgi:hypothetical protein
MANAGLVNCTAFPDLVKHCFNKYDDNCRKLEQTPLPSYLKGDGTRDVWAESIRPQLKRGDCDADFVSRPFADMRLPGRCTQHG